MNKVIYIVSASKDEVSKEIILDYITKNMLDKVLKLSIPYDNFISVIKDKKEKYVKECTVDDFIKSINKHVKEQKFLKVAIDENSNIYIYPEAVGFNIEKTEEIQELKKDKDIDEKKEKEEVSKKEEIIDKKANKPETMQKTASPMERDKNITKPNMSPFAMNELYKSMRISFLSMMNSLPKYEYNYLYLINLIYNGKVDKETLNIKKVKLGVAAYVDNFIRHNLKMLLGKQYANIVDEKIDLAIINLLENIDKKEDISDRLKEIISDENVQMRLEKIKNYQQLPIQSESENKIYEQISASICSLLKTKNLLIKNNTETANEYELAQLHTLLDSIYISEIAVPLIKPFYNDFMVNITNSILDNIALVNTEIWQKSSVPIAIITQEQF